MTEHRDDNDNDLKAYLEGRDGVSATYGKLEKPEVPAHLDDLILKAARRDGDTDGVAKKSSSYFSQKYSIAASVMIVVLIGAVYLSDRDVLQRDSESISAPERQAEADLATAALDETTSSEADDSVMPRQQQALMAPEPAVQDRAAELVTEEIVVTGSRIRLDDSAASQPPVNVVDLPEQAEAAASEETTLESFLAESPASSIEQQLPPADLALTTIYRDDPVTWASHINNLTEELEALAQPDSTRSTDLDQNENTEEVVITASRVRQPDEGNGLAAAGNAAPQAAEAREEISEEDSLQARLELERREFSSAYPDIDLDEMIEEIRDNQ